MGPFYKLTGNFRQHAQNNDDDGSQGHFGSVIVNIGSGDPAQKNANGKRFTRRPQGGNSLSLNPRIAQNNP
jgi:hypothetical protein